MCYRVSTTSSPLWRQRESLKDAVSRANAGPSNQGKLGPLAGAVELSQRAASFSAARSSAPCHLVGASGVRAAGRTAVAAPGRRFSPP